MGDVVRLFARRHARTSSARRSSTRGRAASWASSSAVTPAERARSVERTADHHSAGMLSRLAHLITDQFLAPTSAAMASRDGQSSMIDLNEVRSDMPPIMGQSVPNCKAALSHDYLEPLGQHVLMVQDDENLAESAWRDAFRRRLKEARGTRSQQDMADLLCISRDAYAKYEAARASAMPIRLLPKFCKICGITLEWLIEGERPAKTKAAPARQRRRA